jgi:phosphoglycerate dehydrogenase-like enzyme
MAPTAISSTPSSPRSGTNGEAEFNPAFDASKPTLYMLDKFHPSAILHAKNLFNVILPSDPEISNWPIHAEYLLIKSSALSAPQIHSAQKLRAIGKQGVGIDRLDAEACAERGIRIFNTPGVNAGAVAELVLALTMTVAREISQIQVLQRSGNAVPKESCSGLILSGKTLGLLGMGNISKAVARIFVGAFGAQIVAYDPYLPLDAWSDMPHERALAVADVLRAADVLSVHVPLTPGTRDLLRLTDMRLMKPTAILINAARGGIVNEDDLAQALEDGVIWGAGIDCHEQEPPTLHRYQRLWKHPRVVSTPHIGAATSQTQMETAVAAVNYVYRFWKDQQ